MLDSFTAESADALMAGAGGAVYYAAGAAPTAMAGSLTPAGATYVQGPPQAAWPAQYYALQQGMAPTLVSHAGLVAPNQAALQSHAAALGLATTSDPNAMLSLAQGLSPAGYPVVYSPAGVVSQPPPQTQHLARAAALVQEAQKKASSAPRPPTHGIGRCTAMSLSGTPLVLRAVAKDLPRNCVALLLQRSTGDAVLYVAATDNIHTLLVSQLRHVLTIKLCSLIRFSLTCPPNSIAAAQQVLSFHSALDAAPLRATYVDPATSTLLAFADVEAPLFRSGDPFYTVRVMFLGNVCPAAFTGAQAPKTLVCVTGRPDGLADLVQLRTLLMERAGAKDVTVDAPTHSVHIVSDPQRATQTVKQVAQVLQGQKLRFTCEPAVILLHDSPVCTPHVQGEAMLGDSLAGQRAVKGPVCDEVEEAAAQVGCKATLKRPYTSRFDIAGTRCVNCIERMLSGLAVTTEVAVLQVTLNLSRSLLTVVFEAASQDSGTQTIARCLRANGFPASAVSIREAASHAPEVLAEQCFAECQLLPQLFSKSRTTHLEGPEATATLTLKVGATMCPSCCQLLSQSLKALIPGVRSCAGNIPDPQQARVAIHYDSARTTEADLMGTLQHLGYQVSHYQGPIGGGSSNSSRSTQARDSGPVHRDPPLSRPPPVVQDTPRLLKVLLDPTQPTKVTEVTYFIGAGNKLLHMDPLGKGSMVEVTEETTPLHFRQKYAMFTYDDGNPMPEERGAFESLLECYKLFNSVEVAKITAGQRLTVFRSGVCPDLKDIANADGGRWVASQLPSSQRYQFWLHFILAMCGGQVMDGSGADVPVCGTVMTANPGSDTLELWVDAAARPGRVSSIGAASFQKMQLMADGRRFEFISHEEAEARAREAAQKAAGARQSVGGGGNGQAAPCKQCPFYSVPGLAMGLFSFASSASFAPNHPILLLIICAFA